MNIIVADAGPLIFLAKLGRLDLIQNQGEEVYIPNAVFNEIRAKKDGASAKIEQATKNWLQVKKVKNQEAVNLLLADLDIGEAEVIVLANELKANRLILDDLDARRFARRINIPIIGTLGILLSAKLQEKIPSVNDEILKLQKHGFWANEKLIDEILMTAGEKE